jgi:hypothetical protein
MIFILVFIGVVLMLALLPLLWGVSGEKFPKNADDGDDWNQPLR